MAGLGTLGCALSLHLSFSNLRSEDVLTESDPFAVISIKNGSNGTFKQVGKTSALKNVKTGGWPEGIEVNFIFEEMQTVKVEVFDYDSRSNHDRLGETTFMLGNLMGSRGQRGTFKLSKDGSKSNHGDISVVADKKVSGGGVLFFHFAAQNLDSKDWGGFGRSDPFFIVYRSVGGSTSDWLVVHQSEWIKNNNNPVWNPVEISLDHLCNNNLDLPLKIVIFDYDKGSQPDLIGELYTTANQIIHCVGQKFDVKHPPTKSKYQKASYKNSGHLEIRACRVVAPPTSIMLDYIAGGTNLNLVVAVDFTGSNGNPSNPNSLHYRGGKCMNQYQSAIAAIGSILQPYDSDGQILAFGFGGEFRGQVSHCFPLNGNPSSPEVQGIQGVMQAYEYALQTVPLSGPTYFAPLLEVVNRSVFNPELSQCAQTYTILLILTDGAIMDMEATIDQIYNSANLPLSLVIAGIGSADMSSMEILDADKGSLRSRSGKVSRDIVQFVPFSECRGNGEALASRTLAEIPGQLVKFFESRNIKPNPPLQATATAVPIASGAPAAPSDSHLAAAGKVVLTQAFAL